jgi:hypothetical protein
MVRDLCLSNLQYKKLINKIVYQQQRKYFFQQHFHNEYIVVKTLLDTDN